MKLEPKLVEVAVPDRPEGVVLVLHGGAARRRSMMVSPTQLSVLRMVPVARRIRRAGRGRLAVFRLLNSRRGWDAHHTPVTDATWAMEEIAERLGGALPTCLVGHSLGGRAAVLAAGRTEVRSAVALAAYIGPGDVPRGVEGKRLLFLHGTRDRIASAQRAAMLAARIGAIADVDFRLVEGGKHAMLSHHGAFTRPAAEFARDTLLGDGRA